MIATADRADRSDRAKTIFAILLGHTELGHALDAQ